MATMTLRSLERGGSGVTMGAYLAVMQVLGIEQDLQLLGAADPLGRKLQGARFAAGPDLHRNALKIVENVPVVERPQSVQSPDQGLSSETPRFSVGNGRFGRFGGFLRSTVGSKHTTRSWNTTSP